jgi:hypothetical protein
MLAILPIQVTVEFQTGNNAHSSLLAFMVITVPALDRQCAGISGFLNDMPLYPFPTCSYIRRLAMSWTIIEIGALFRGREVAETRNRHAGSSWSEVAFHFDTCHTSTQYVRS